MGEIIPDDDRMLSGYLDDALDEAERAKVSRRLDTDPAYAAQLKALRQNDTLIKAAYNQPINDSIPVRLLKGLLSISVTHPPFGYKRGAIHRKSNNMVGCWLLPKSVAKPLVQFYRKHSR